jgi:hypothetical protein
MQFPGQGNHITVIRDEKFFRVITIEAEDVKDKECVDDGIGFTMAMTWLGEGQYLQCSLPIGKGNDPAGNSLVHADEPGCCLVINDEGKVVATFRGNGINGPWGAISHREGELADDIAFSTMC